MTIEVHIQHDTVVPVGSDLALRNAAQALLDNRQVSSAELTIMLTNDEELRRLNHQYRGVDKTTDVLSFGVGEESFGMASENVYLGDIVISVPTAAHQAKNKGHSALAELQLLAIHGILHLLGFDHARQTDKTAMWSLQREVLDSLGLAHIEPTED